MMDNIYMDLNFNILKHNVTGKSSKIVVLTDPNTTKYCLPVLKKYLKNVDFLHLEIPVDESTKDINLIVHIWKLLLENRIDRYGLVINLGGGVLSDTGGFAASTYKRGISYINIPTTLLAMVDASIGGKTGINFLGIKNQIGSIQQPEGIYINPLFLNTLPEKEIKSGRAEMIKHGLIASYEHFQKLLNTSPIPEDDLIIESAQIKNEIIQKDPEENGLRRILNFGHTFGHAIESFLREKGNPVTHGHAVAIGMLLESFLSTLYAGLSLKEFEKIKDFILQNYKIPEFDSDNLDNSLIHLMHHDKKNKSGEIRFVLLNKIGSAAYDYVIDKKDIKRVINTFLV